MTAPRLGSWQADPCLAIGGAAEVWSLEADGLPPAVWKIAHRDVPEAHAAMEREWRALHRIAVDVLPEPLLWTPATAERGPGVVMRRLPGAPMSSCFGELGVEQAVRLLADALAALAVVHDAGLVHGDLHAGNVMIDAAAGRARLLDLGLAQAEGPPIAPGVPACAAPERLRGEAVDPADDLFSLASAVAMARGWPASYPEHPALAIAPTARPLGPDGPDRALFEAIAPWLSPARAERPRHARAALDRWCAHWSIDRPRRASGGERVWWFPMWGADCPERPTGHSVVWGPPGSGRSGVLAWWGEQARRAGSPVALVSPRTGGFAAALATLGLPNGPDAPRAPAAVRTPVDVRADARIGRLATTLADLRAALGPDGLLLFDAPADIDPALPGLLAALGATGGADVAWEATAAVPRVVSVAVPAITEGEVAAGIAARRGAQVSSALAAALATHAGGARRALLRLVDHLIDADAVRLEAGRWAVPSDVGSDTAAVVAEAAMTLRPGRAIPAADVPLLAQLAVAGRARPGDVADPASRWSFARWWSMPEVRIDGAGAVLPIDATCHARLLDALPVEALATAAAERLDAACWSDPTEAAWLAVRAAADGRRTPPDVEVLRRAASEQLASGHAADAAALVTAWLDAAEVGESAPAALRTGRVLQATALTRLGRFEDAARVFDGLSADDGPDDSDNAEADGPGRAMPTDVDALLARAELGFLRGDYPAARAAAEAVLASPEAAPEARAAAGTWAAYAATWQGDLDGADALRAGLEGDAAAYLDALLCYYRGQLDDAAAGFAGLSGASSLAVRAAAASGRGLVAHRRGELGAARDGYDAGRALAEQAGDRSRVLNMTMNIAILDHEGGEIGQALGGYRAARAQARALGDAGAEARCLLNEGILAVSLGRFGEAGRMLADAVRRFDAAGNDYLRAMALAAHAEAARRGGDVGRAEELVAAAQSAIGTDGVETERVEIDLEAVHVAIDAGDPARALRLLEAPLAAARDAGHDELVGRARAARGRALLSRADQEREAEASRALLEQAIDELQAALERLPASKPMHRVTTAVDRAVALARAGRWSAAAEAARSARSELRSVHASLTGADADAFRAAPALAMTWAIAELLSESAAVSTAAGLIGSAREGVEAPATSTALLALLQRLSAERDRGRLLEGLLDAAAVLTGAERSFLLLNEARHDAQAPVSLQVAVARNIDRGRMDSDAYALSRNIAEEVFASGERVIATDAQRDPRFAEHASVHAAQLRSILVVPLSLRGRTVGVLYVDNRFAAGAFEAGHARVLEALAAQAAIAIDTADLLERQRLDAAELGRQRAEISTLNERLSAELERTQDALASARQALAAQRDDAARGEDYAEIVGESPRLQAMFRLMDRVRDHDFPVLIRGESGTGKELVARALHRTGARARGPFVAINCGAVPENLLESELFGHLRGAFTGAVQSRQGLWAQADGGTLMLDEVGEMPPSMQVKLLRVLQTGEFTPVGGTEQRKADVRVLAATHRDLGALVREGRFREDLLYRLRVVELPVPALRERREDLPLLAAHFLEQNVAAGIGTANRLTRAALRLMERHRWPGNIRELETVLKSACVFVDGERIDAADLQPLLDRNAATRDDDVDELDLAGLSLDEIITRAIAARVQACEGNKSKAARSLGIDRGTLYNRLREAGSDAEG